MDLRLLVVLVGVICLAQAYPHFRRKEQRGPQKEVDSQEASEEGKLGRPRPKCVKADDLEARSEEEENLPLCKPEDGSKLLDCVREKELKEYPELSELGLPLCKPPKEDADSKEDKLEELVRVLARALEDESEEMSGEKGGKGKRPPPGGKGKGSKPESGEELPDCSLEDLQADPELSERELPRCKPPKEGADLKEKLEEVVGVLARALEDEKVEGDKEMSGGKSGKGGKRPTGKGKGKSKDGEESVKEEQGSKERPLKDSEEMKLVELEDAVARALDELESGKEQGSKKKGRKGGKGKGAKYGPKKGSEESVDVDSEEMPGTGEEKQKPEMGSQEMEKPEMGSQEMEKPKIDSQEMEKPEIDSQEEMEKPEGSEVSSGEVKRTILRKALLRALVKLSR